MKAIKKAKIKGAQFYKVGEKVETIHPATGAWVTADIIDISPDSKCKCPEDCLCLYKLVLEGNEDEDLQILDKKLNEIRQVTYASIDWDKLKIGMKVVINYNIEKPKQWGFWYDYIIENITKRDDVYFLCGTLLVGLEGSSKKIPVKIDSDNVADVLEIRPHATLEEKEMDYYETGTKPDYCKKCKNKPKVRCKTCCCCKCGTKKDFELTVQCDECNDWYHIYCIKPPIKELPQDEDWYCPECDNKTQCAKLQMKQIFKKQKRNNLKKSMREKSGVRKSFKSIKNVTKKVLEEDKTETVASVEKPKCSADVEVMEITKIIEKESHIWNEIKELYSDYELIGVTAKVIKKREFKGFISCAAEEFISKDVVNHHLWEETKQSLNDGKQSFLECVKRIFTCAICCELLNDPITLSCKHNFCIDCFFRSLSVNVYNCALCRVDIIQTQHYVVNENLKGALGLLFGKTQKITP